jgi:hypothetical protein
MATRSLALAALLCLSCSQRPPVEQPLYGDALDSLDGVLSRSGTSLDAGVSRDGKGSLRVDATAPTTIRIAEVQPQQAEDAVLIYRASLRSQDLEGQAYLEMWCSIPGMGEFFSRALQAPIQGTTGWMSQETPFFLKAGQVARTVKLNLVVQGKGTVWIDDLSLAIARN